MIRTTLLVLVCIFAPRADATPPTTPFDPNTVLVVGSELDFPPLALGTNNKGSTARGFTVDLWKAVAAEAGLRYAIRVRPFHDLLVEFERGEIDVLINLAYTNELRNLAEFSVPHYVAHGAIFIRKDESGIYSEADLVDRSLIVIKGDLDAEYIRSRGWQDQLVPVDSAAEAMRLLSDGRHDAVLMAKVPGLYTTRALGFDKVTTAEQPAQFAQKFSFAVHKGQSDLLARINEALAVTKSNGRYDAIYERWFGLYEERPLSTREILYYVVPLLAVILLMLVYSLYRRQGSLARKAAAEHLRQVLDSSHDAFIGMDVDGRINDWNEAAATMFGWSRVEVLGRLLADTIIPERTRAAHARGLQRFLRTGEGVLLRRRLEVEGLRRSGEEFPIELGVWPVGSGRTLRFSAFIQDISERRWAQQQILMANATLEERVEQRTEELRLAMERADTANRAKSEFLAIMSHEIRTPMNGVVGMAEVLRQSRLDAGAAEAVDVIRNSAFSLLRIIDDMLDFSKIEAGRVELLWSSVYLHDLIETLCQSLVGLAQAGGVELRLVIEPPVPEQVSTDPDRLRRILTNLLSNAIKFSGGRPDQRGQVELRVSVASASPCRLRFIVSDNGIGMNAQTIGRLFTPFTQAEASTTRRYGGTGLGLAISKRLVQLFDGEIHVSSTPGLGTQFTAELPFELAAELPVRAKPDLSGVTCIVVRGPEAGAEDVAAALRAAAVDVAIADHLEAAVLLAAQQAAPVLVHLCGQCDLDLSTLLERFAGATRHLLLLRGRRRRMRALTKGVFMLDGDALSPRALLQAVAEIKGLAAPAADQAAPGANTELQHGAALRIDPAIAQGCRILVAEDDEINQKVLRRQLDLLGLTCDIADDGAQALKRWRQHPPHLLLTDLHMPELDGYGLTAAIRAEESATARLPIIALTANALHGEAERALAAGMNEYLTKPTQLDTLRAALLRWLRPQSASTLTIGSDTGPAPAIGTAVVEVGSTPSRAATMRPAVDVAMLRSYIGDVDDAALRDFLQFFRDNLRVRAGELQRAVAADDRATVGRIAHKLKSSSHSVGALDLSELCLALEAAGRDGDRPGIDSGMARFDAIVAAVEAGLGVLLAPLPQ